MVRLSLIVIIIGIAFMNIYAQEELYSDKHDNLDIISLLNNEESRREYYECFMDIGLCTEIGAHFKEIYPEAYQTQCKKCTEKQKVIFSQAAEWYMQNRPDDWQKILDKAIEYF